MYPLLIAFRHGEFALYGIGHLVIQRDGLARSLHVDHTRRTPKAAGGGQQKRPKRKKFDFFHMKV